MNKHKKFYFVSAVFSFLFFLAPSHEAHAAEVYFAPHAENIYSGDVFVLEAKISSPDELINVADGAILFNKDVLEVKELSVGGSIFSLWASGPSFSNTEGRVNFVGGVPNGFQSADGLMLKIIFRAKRSDTAKIFFEDGFSLLRGDGNGTNINPSTRPLVLRIAERQAQVPPKDEWKDIMEADTAPPTFIEAVISKDARFFDNKYFVSFFATDEKSGVAHYEIKEGDGHFARAVSPYALQDQSLRDVVQIKSIDSAGNESIIIPEITRIPQEPFYTTTFFWVAVLVLLVLGANGFRARFKKYKHLK